MSRQAEMSQIVICLLVLESIYMFFRLEKLAIKWLCIKQSFFSFIITYLVFSKAGDIFTLKIYQGIHNEGIAKEGEVEDADFEVVEDEK